MKKLAKNEFVLCCDQAIAELLADHSFRLSSTRIDRWFTRAEFVNATTGLVFRHEIRDQRVFLDIARLVDGKIERQPLLIKANSILHCYSFDDYLLVSQANAGIASHLERKTPACEQVRWYAEQLRQHGVELLMGEFGVFSELDTVLKDRLMLRS